MAPCRSQHAMAQLDAPLILKLCLGNRRDSRHGLLFPVATAKALPDFGGVLGDIWSFGFLVGN